MRLCECGCGAEVNRRFVPGHNGTGRKRKWLSFICIHCGATSEAMRSLAIGRKFCSSSCRDAYRIALTGKPEHPSRTKKITECWICHKSFEATPTQIKRGITCSMECGKESRKRRIKGTKRRSSKFRINWRKEARERDGHRCRICGFHEVIHTHHIVPKAKGGDHTLDNFITVCPNHHAMIHAGMISPERLIEIINSPPPQQFSLDLGRVVNFRK